MISPKPLCYRVAEDEDGWLLRTVLVNRLRLSRKLLSKLKRCEQGITVNGARAWVSVPVWAGDLVEVWMPAERSDDILPQDIAFRVIFEDSHLLIVDKPAGLIVHPTHGHYINTLANGVVHYWREKGEECRFRPVHRLDKDTSGVLAIAKTPYAHQQISAQMQAGRVDKTYLAVAHFAPHCRKGTISAAIDRDNENPHIRVVAPGGLTAITHYAVQEVYGSPPAASLLSLRLETGRTHQIRVHLQHLGCPLFADSMYGIQHSECSDRERQSDGWIGRQALHASRLAFDHPVAGHRVEFTAELPEDMEQLLQRLRQNFC